MAGRREQPVKRTVGGQRLEQPALGQGIAGTADEVAAEIARQGKAAGINYFLCRFAFGDISLAEAERSLDLFQKYVT